MSREKVSRLLRIGPPANRGYFYYTPDGHAIGPFDSIREMETDLAEHYEEALDSEYYSQGWL